MGKECVRLQADDGIVMEIQVRHQSQSGQIRNVGQLI